MRLSHSRAIIFSGILWMAIGIFLLQKGVHLIVDSSNALFTGADPSFLINYLTTLSGNYEQGAMILIILGLLLGFFKGRFILSKTVKRVCKRIRSYSSPVAIKNLYAPSYYIILGSMMVLGMTFRFLPLPIDIRGLIDVAIGAALANGALLYFRQLSKA